MPILEANAVGRAVIASAIAPLTDIANGSAHLVHPTDIKAIRQGIVRLIEDDIYREKLITAGWQNAQTYTLEKAASQYATLYHQLFRPDSL